MIDIQAVNDIFSESAKIAVTIVTAVLGWLIVQQVKANTHAMNEVKNMVRKVESDGLDRGKEIVLSLTNMKIDFESKFANMFKMVTEEQREMERRWEQSLKVLTDKSEGFAARISELSEAQAILERNMYRDFMPTQEIKSVVTEVKQNAKEFMVNVDKKIDNLFFEIRSIQKGRHTDV